MILIPLASGPRISSKATCRSRAIANPRLAATGILSRRRPTCLAPASIRSFHFLSLSGLLAPPQMIPSASLKAKALTLGPPIATYMGIPTPLSLNFCLHTATDSAISATVAGLQPRVLTALSPDPTPRIPRPPDMSWIVSMALAVTLGWRVRGLVTPGPIRMREVFTAHAAAIAHRSG